MTQHTCTACGGTGRIYLWRSETDPRFIRHCEKCFGTGRIENESDLTPYERPFDPSKWEEDVHEREAATSSTERHPIENTQDGQ